MCVRVSLQTRSESLSCAKNVLYYTYDMYVEKRLALHSSRHIRDLQSASRKMALSYGAADRITGTFFTTIISG